MYKNSRKEDATIKTLIPAVYDFIFKAIMLNPDNLDYLKTIINEITKIPMDDLDVYASNSDRTTYSKRILGDATGEMGPFYSSGSYYYNNWYNDYSRFVESSNQWFTRGGGYNYGSGAD